MRKTWVQTLQNSSLPKTCMTGPGALQASILKLKLKVQAIERGVWALRSRADLGEHSEKSKKMWLNSRSQTRGLDVLTAQSEVRGRQLNSRAGRGSGTAGHRAYESQNAHRTRASDSDYADQPVLCLCTLRMATTLGVYAVKSYIDKAERNHLRSAPSE